MPANLGHAGPGPPPFGPPAGPPLAPGATTPLGGWDGGPAGLEPMPYGDFTPDREDFAPERPWYLRKRVLLMVAVVLLAWLVSIGSRENQERQQRQSAPASASSGEAPAPVSSAPRGPVVRDGNLSIGVGEVRCGVDRIGRGLRSRAAKGQFCLVSLTVANVGEQPWALPFIGQSLVDADGRRYGPDFFARGVVQGGEAVWKELAPGGRTAGTLVFELPARTVPVKLELNDTPLSGPVAVAIER